MADQRCAGLSPSTRRKALAVLFGFFGYLHDRGAIPTIPVKPIERPQLDDPEPTYWEADEVRELLIGCTNHGRLGHVALGVVLGERQGVATYGNGLLLGDDSCGS